MLRESLSFLAVALLVPIARSQTIDLPEAQRKTIHEHLRVTRFQATRVTPEVVAGRLQAIVEFEDATFALDLPRRSVRGDDYALVERSGGATRTVSPPAVATYRGEAFRENDPTRWRAAVTFRDGSLRGYLHAETGEIRVIQPIAEAIAGSDRAIHAAFRDVDVLPHDGVCVALASSIDAAKQHRHSTGSSPGWLPATAAATFKLAEVAFEGDVLYFNQVGGSGPAATDIDTLMNAIASIYEAEVGITYEITQVILQTDGSEQYSSIDSEILLEQYRNFWNANNGGVVRDTSHLLTGKNLVGSTIGIAFVGVICNKPFGYGLSQTNFSANLLDRVSLTAHEIGHNWNAGHCDDKNDCGIMCSFIDSCDGDYQQFGNSEENEIEDFRDQSDCLSNSTPALTTPFLETFEEDSLDGEFWSTNKGAAVSSKAKGETSGKQSAVVDFDDKLISKAIDPTTLTDPELSFYVADRGVDSGESLAVEFKDANGDWQPLTTVTSDGTTKSTFRKVRATMTAPMLHDALKIRLKPNANQSNDDWYIDDFEVREKVAIPAATLATTNASATVVRAHADSLASNLDFPVSNGGDGTAAVNYLATEVVAVPWLSLANTTGTVTTTAETGLVGSSIDASSVAMGTVSTTRVRVTQTNGGVNDYYENVLTLVMTLEASFISGDTFDGTIEVAADVDTTYTYVLGGSTLAFEAMALAGGLKPTITVKDSGGATVATLDFGKNDVGVTQSTTLGTSGIYTVEVSGRSSTTGTYDFATAITLPESARVQTLKLSPATAGGDVTATFDATYGTRLNLTAAARAEGFGPYSATIVDPDGLTLHATLFTSQLPDGGVLIRGLPLTVSGEYTVTISGFADTETITLTIDPIAPAAGTAALLIG